MLACEEGLALEREPGQRRRWGRVVARAWDDNAFRQRLLDEPIAVLCEEGIEVPEGIEVRIVEDEAPHDTDGSEYLRLPARPGVGELVEDDLGFPEGLPPGETARSCTGGNCRGCSCRRCNSCRRSRHA